MATPNEYDLVVATANANPQLLEVNTLATIREFMLILGPKMRGESAYWGYLTKSQGEKHITLPDGQFVAVDAFIYQPTQTVVDVLSNAADPAFGPASPSWGETDKRPENHWYPIKDYNGGPVPGPNPPTDGKDAEQDQKIASLEARVAALESKPIGTIDGKHIALRAQQNDKFLRGRFDTNDPIVAADSNDSQSYETFIIKDMG